MLHGILLHVNYQHIKHQELHFIFISEKFYTKRDLVKEEMEITTAKLEQVTHNILVFSFIFKTIKDDEEDFGTGKFAKYQKIMWDLIEKPDTSTAASAISIMSNLFVAVSIVGMTISTLPSLQYEVESQH